MTGDASVVTLRVQARTPQADTDDVVEHIELAGVTRRHQTTSRADENPPRSSCAWPDPSAPTRARPLAGSSRRRRPLHHWEDSR